METTISDFHTSFYIPEIRKLVLHNSRVQILGTSHCGESRQTVFKHHESFQDVICWRDYDDMVVSSFSNQIQSEYYGENRSMSIEVIALGHFSTLPNSVINASTKSCPHHAVVHSFLSGDSIQNSATTTSHSKNLIQLSKERKVFAS